MVAPKKVVKNLLKTVTKFYEMGKCATKMTLWQINLYKEKSNKVQAINAMEPVNTK